MTAPMINTCPDCGRHDVNMWDGEGLDRCPRCEDAALRVRLATVEADLAKREAMRQTCYDRWQKAEDALIVARARILELETEADQIREANGLT